LSVPVDRHFSGKGELGQKTSIRLVPAFMSIPGPGAIFIGPLGKRALGAVGLSVVAFLGGFT